MALALVLVMQALNLYVTRRSNESRQEHEKQVERLLAEIRDKLPGAYDQDPFGALIQGSIRQRSPGSWELTINLGRDLRGKRRRKHVPLQGRRIP